MHRWTKPAMSQNDMARAGTLNDEPTENKQQLNRASRSGTSSPPNCERKSSPKFAKYFTQSTNSDVFCLFLNEKGKTVASVSLAVHFANRLLNSTELASLHCTVYYGIHCIIYGVYTVYILYSRPFPTWPSSFGSFSPNANTTQLPNQLYTTPRTCWSRLAWFLQQCR